MKYYIILGTLVTDHKYSESTAKEKAIQYKKMFPKTKVKIIPESEVKKNDKNVLSNDDTRKN